MIFECVSYDDEETYKTDPIEINEFLFQTYKMSQEQTNLELENAKSSLEYVKEPHEGGPDYAWIQMCGELNPNYKVLDHIKK